MAARILEAHIRENRVASSYIFSGQGESGTSAELATDQGSTDIKEEFAVSFACALENGDKKLFGSQNANVTQRILKRNYPDVRWLGEDLSARSIKIEAVRDVIQWAYRKAFEGTWKICIVPKAERLTEEAANAFLKTLEEPPERTVFCLLVDNKENLLETIQSRSFEIRLMAAPLGAAPLGNALEALPVREIFENYPGLTREELKQKLDHLMRISRERLVRLTAQGTDSDAEIRRWLEAMDLLYDSKAALDMNVNQKLMITRLAMCLRRLFPSQKVVI